MTEQAPPGVRITAAGIVQLFNVEDDSQVGLDGPTLATGVWYRIEIDSESTSVAAFPLEDA